MVPTLESALPLGLNGLELLLWVVDRVAVVGEVRGLKVRHALVVEHGLPQVSGLNCHVEICPRIDSLDGSHQTFYLFGAHVLAELLRLQQLLGVLDDVLGGDIVLTWRVQGAFWAPHVEDHVALEVNCRLLQLFEPLGLKQVPHLFLGDLVPFLDQLPLLLVKQNRSDPLPLLHDIVEADDSVLGQVDSAWAGVGQVTLLRVRI